MFKILCYDQDHILQWSDYVKPSWKGASGFLDCFDNMNEPIVVSNVSHRSFENCVMFFCLNERLPFEQNNSITKPNRETDIFKVVQSDYATLVCNMSDIELINTHKTADYLYIQGLIDLTRIAIAMRLKNLTSQEISSFFTGDAIN